MATKYHRQVGRFLDRYAVHHRLVHINGAIEAAPMIGTADVVSDLASSGATLRENNLRPLDDGVITKSSACMVANLRALRGSPEKLAEAKTVLELIEARLRAEGFYNNHRQHSRRLDGVGRGPGDPEPGGVGDAGADGGQRVQ